MFHLEFFTYIYRSGNKIRETCWKMINLIRICYSKSDFTYIDNDESTTSSSDSESTVSSSGSESTVLGSDAGKDYEEAYSLKPDWIEEYVH